MTLILLLAVITGLALYFAMVHMTEKKKTKPPKAELNLFATGDSRRTSYPSKSQKTKRSKRRPKGQTGRKHPKER